MIEINLAPGAERARSSRRRLDLPIPSLPALGADLRLVGVGAVALLGLLAIGFSAWRQGARERELSTRLEQEVTDSTRFATALALVHTLQARQDTIEQKIGVIRGVDQRRYVWPHLLDEISGAVPAFTWLTSIGSQEAAEPPPAPLPGDSAAARGAAPVGPTVTLQGQAGSTQALTRFMKNLESSPFIREVTLVTSEQVDREGRIVHRFTLEARYQMPDSSVIATVPILPVQ